jgi:hypothetical protein
MATWLASHFGVSLITARQYVHVAHAIQKFPILKAQFAPGDRFNLDYIVSFVLDARGHETRNTPQQPKSDAAASLQ